MKRFSAIIRPVSFCLLVVVSLVIIDISTTPPTTSQMTQRAAEQLARTGATTPPTPFYHDGCSLFPDQLPWHDFRSACLTHDITYWAGGTAAERKQADLALRSEIAHTGPLGPVLAPVMYAGVRIFGNSWLTRAVGANWGYGWN
jgi:hypothetical protein